MSKEIELKDYRHLMVSLFEMKEEASVKEPGRGHAAARTASVFFCSIARMSPQAKHRKVCSSVKDATLGSMRTSVVDIPQIGHDSRARSPSI